MKAGSMRRYITRRVVNPATASTATPWIWWANPSALNLFLMVPIYVAASLFALAHFPGTARLQYKGEVGMTLPLFVFGLICLVSYSLGAFAPSLLPSRSMPKPRRIPGGVLLLLLAMTLLGYATFFAGALKGGVSQVGDLLHGDTGAVYGIRKSGQLIAGISSMVAVGPVFGVGVVLSTFADSRWRAFFWISFGFVLVLCLARAVIWSERLAIAELLIPSAIVWVLKYGASVPSVFRPFMFMAPVFAIVVLLIGFTLGETIRSWPSNVFRYQHNLIQFSIDRIVLYYSTALNNGAGYINLDVQNPPLVNTFQLFYILESKLPSHFYNFISPVAISDHQVQIALNYHYSAEFNNPSGLFSYISDYGYYFSIPIFFLFGLLVGFIYKRTKGSDLFACAIIPFVILGTIEILRIPYLGAGRMTYVYIGLAILFAGILLGERGVKPAAPRGILIQRRLTPAQAALLQTSKGGDN